jgi:hypothetical protein
MDIWLQKKPLQLAVRIMSMKIIQLQLKRRLSQQIWAPGI